MQKIKGLIYCVTNNVNGKRYIGQTYSSNLNYTVEKILTMRKSVHLHKSRVERKQYIHKAIYKYGVDKFTWEIIDTCDTREDLNEKEVYYINMFDTFSSKNGYNLTKGGDGALGRKMDATLKNKISELNSISIIEITTEKIFRSLTEASKYYGIPVGRICNVCNDKDNCKQTEGLSFAKLDDYENNKEEYIQKAFMIRNQMYSKYGAKAVINLDTGKVFKSISEAGIYYNIDNSAITKVCKNIKHTCGGYRWKYYYEYVNTELIGEFKKSSTM